MDSIPSPQSFIFSDEYVCQWDACLKNFDKAEQLYEHLISDHVGRKAQHNLCLTCHWESCGTPTFNKRDHITSHLRIHVDSKPHSCDICNKGFKRRQDLKKHERTHQDNPSAGENNFFEPPSSLLQPGSHGHSYQPLTPPSYMDRSPSIAASTVSYTQPRYHTPMSPASMADSSESWNNVGLSSPSISTSSELYNSPRLQDLDVNSMNSQVFERLNIDISGTYYGAFPTTSGIEDIMSPMSAKRARDGVDEILSDTLGSFAMEAKKKRLDPSYSEDMMGRLDAISAILDVSPLTPDRLLTSLPDSDWNQYNELNQFCSALFEDVSGEVFEQRTFDTLFPDYKQQQNPVAVNSGYGVDGYSNYNAALNPNFNISNIGNNAGFSEASQAGSIYSTVIPDDPYISTSTAPSMMYGSENMQWDMASTAGMPMAGVVKATPARNTVQQPTNPFDRRCATINNVMNPAIKVEPKEEVFEPKVVVKVERIYADMSTQTKPKPDKNAFEGGVMMKQRPVEKKQTKSLYEGMDPELVLLNAPAVPNTLLPQPETKEFSIEDLERDGEDRIAGQYDVQESRDTDSTPTSNTQSASSSRFGVLAEKARAKQAAVAAAAAAAPTEALDPLEAMTRQLAETRLDDSRMKVISRPPTVKPLLEGGMDRQIKAANARARCSQDPVRKQHAEVVLSLLKSIDSLMADHRRKVAVWKEVEARQQHQHQHQQPGATASRSPSAGSSPSMYPRTGVNVQSQGQIRTVSSYLPRRAAPQQLSPLHQNHTRSDPDYNQLRSNLTENRPSPSNSPVLYPTSDLHMTSEEPFELSEEERRFIEEDIAKTAAALAQDPQYVHV